MDTIDAVVVAAAGVWGVLFAAWYHWTRMGRFVTRRMSFLAVALMFTSNLLFLLLMANGDGQIHLRDVAAISAVALIGPSIEGVASLYAYFKDLMDAEQERSALQNAVGVTRRPSGDD